VLTGPERRRKWPDEIKIAIVAEAFAKDVVVSEVARHHAIAHSQLFGLMRRFASSRARVVAREHAPRARATRDALRAMIKKWQTRSKNGSAGVSGLLGECGPIFGEADHRTSNCGIVQGELN